MATDQNEQQPRASAMPRMKYIEAAELIVGVIVLLLWVVLLTLGTTIGTKPYRDALANAAQVPVHALIGYVLIVALCYTWTNVAILASMASLLGGLTQWAQTPPQQKSYLSIILPGFFAYVVAAAWTITFSKTDDAVNPSQITYIKLAWLVSLISFLVGYNRQLFPVLIQRVEETVATMLGTGRPRPPAPPLAG